MADAAPPNDFRQKLTLSIIDKLVFGLLIVLAGFVLNFVLENHRADQAMKNEIARLRVAKVAEIWQALDRHQRAVVSLGEYEVARLVIDLARIGAPNIAPAGTTIAEPATLTVYEGRSAVVQREQARLTALVETNRFWIGERLYPKYRDYAAKQRRLHRAYRDVGLGLVKAARITISRDEANAPKNRARMKAAYDRGMRVVRERRRELKELRTDVFSAMERLS